MIQNYIEGRPSGGVKSIAKGTKKRFFKTPSRKTSTINITTKHQVVTKTQKKRTSLSSSLLLDWSCWSYWDLWFWVAIPSCLSHVVGSLCAIRERSHPTMPLVLVHYFWLGADCFSKPDFSSPFLVLPICNMDLDQHGPNEPASLLWPWMWKLPVRIHQVVNLLGAAADLGWWYCHD